MSRPAAPGPRELARAAMERVRDGTVPSRSSGTGLQLAVRPSTDGLTYLINALNGELVSPCASPAIAERTKAFFAS